MAPVAVDPRRAVAPLLAADEPPAVALLPAAHPGAPALLACDHASPRVPRSLAGLGLPALELHRHIGWDIGAADLTVALAGALGWPAVLAGYSRLVVDCNRHLDDPAACPLASDGTGVPGNAALAPADRAARADALYWPYHAALGAALAALATAGGAAALIAIHSFTPVLAGRRRAVEVGVLWDTDDRIAAPLLAALRRIPGLVVGDNQPYSGRSPVGFTVGYHAGRRGLPHVAIEVRQDLLADPAGVARWARLLAAALESILPAARAVPDPR
jgi:predicted N-formylglutamate amidohydrolase